MLVICLAAVDSKARGQDPTRPADAVTVYTLGRTNLSGFRVPAYPPESLARARRNGLKFDDLPSLGSGLARISTNQFVGITDRGPNGVGGEEESKGRRTFPLPEFCPAIVKLTVTNSQIRVSGVVPLHDGKGRFLTGLSTTEGEERLYESADATQPIPLDPDGVDPEAIRLLPDGSYLVSEEYSPSVLVVAPDGRVLVRYTPKGKPLPGATYPVREILPSVFAERRMNKGFENLALSADGKWAYAILQSPMGDVAEPRYAESRVHRVLKLDVGNALEAKVVAEYLALGDAADHFPGKQAQQKIYWSDADWIGPDRLLVIERGKHETHLVTVDLSRATNILGRSGESGLSFEDSTQSPVEKGVTAAEPRQVWSTRGRPEFEGEKLEGLAVLQPSEVALANDNDFGIGENPNGRPSRLWIVHLASPLPLTEAR